MDTINIIFALDSTFFEARLTRPGGGQMLEAEAKILASRPVWSRRGLNITAERFVRLFYGPVPDDRQSPDAF